MTTSQALEQAVALHRAGRLDEAARLCEQVLAAEPDNAQALHLLGVSAHQSGRQQQSIECIRRAIQLDPDCVAFHADMSAVQAAGGNLKPAIESLRQVTRLAPDEPQPHEDLGLLLTRVGLWADAAASFRRALELRPDSATALNNLGNTLNQQGRPSEALACFRALVRDHPDAVEGYVNLGNTLKSLGQVDEAIEQYRAALHIAPGHPAARENLARTLRSWNGQPLAGRSILVHCNFGFGDTLQFVRYVPLVQQRGAGRVLLAAQPELHELLAASGFGELLVSPAETHTCDVEVSIMDLPCLIPDETTQAVPYLRPAAADVAKWRQELAPLDGLRVGIAWQGNREFVWDKLRSIPLAAFEPLARVPSVRLISLQKGEGRDQLRQVAGRFAVNELSDPCGRQFTDTAAIIENLDLVITSDSAVAHLAGALAAPVWVALRRNPDWRWKNTGDDTHWYPSMRLFRQSHPGDWPGVFARLAEALAERAAASRTATDEEILRG